ncbi:hypothetical protein BACCIP111899_01356 [Bacillus rhizoplanae]|uniref:Cell wall binding repeat-containing protein n=1 Tax=Bacillus rhizoplanae TaxID=2880966 RepID=A0ABN7ZY18_9BACI|nr:hypothetical protein [Bacillus rhizoplanae]CAG9612184.1 hypothetical protein BACCIP111899_01356 [Bacillus rhizoplanae]
MKKITLPILMFAVFIVPAASHAEETVVLKNDTNKEEQVITQTRWIKEGSIWSYYGQHGVKKTSWLHDGGKWYYFNSDGKRELSNQWQIE